MFNHIENLKDFLTYRHEIVGVVIKTGNNVQKFKVGDRAGVGVIVGSCRTCDVCQQDLENYCPKLIFTYNSTDKDGTRTYGGYSDIIVVTSILCFVFLITYHQMPLHLYYVPASQSTAQ